MDDKERPNLSTSQQSEPITEPTTTSLTPFKQYTTTDGFLLPSIHSAPPFFTYQPNPTTQAIFTAQWTRLILSYAQHRNFFYLMLGEATAENGKWAEVLKNDRINRRVKMAYLSRLFDIMIENRLATYWPLTGQRDQLLIFWRSPEEWGELVFDYVSSIGAINAILTYDDIGEAPPPNLIAGVPIEVLRIGMELLEKAGRAQFIQTSEGEGVRFFNIPRA